MGVKEQLSLLTIAPNRHEIEVYKVRKSIILSCAIEQSIQYRRSVCDYCYFSLTCAQIVEKDYVCIFVMKVKSKKKITYSSLMYVILKSGV